MGLEKLQVQQAPAAFASTAAAHNALAQLIAGMRGSLGIRVQVSDGGIVVSFDPTAAIGTGLGGGGVGGDTLQVLGVDGLRRSVYTDNANYSNGYSDLVRIGNSGPKVELGGNTSTFGLKITSNTNTATFAFSNLTKNMSFIEIDVCSANVAKKMLVLGSAPY